MSDFSIQYSKVMDESDRITRQVQNVRQMSTSVRNIYQVLSENSTSSMNRVCRTLLTIEKNILTEAEKSKRAGTLSNEEIEAFYQSFAPMLDASQRKRLRAVVDRLKEI